MEVKQEVNRVTRKKPVARKKQQEEDDLDSDDDKCYRCGQTGHYFRDKICPARGKTCDKCNKIGHFSVVCRSKEKSKGKRAKGNQKVRFNTNSL